MLYLVAGIAALVLGWSLIKILSQTPLDLLTRVAPWLGVLALLGLALLMLRLGQPQAASAGVVLAAVYALMRRYSWWLLGAVAMLWRRKKQGATGDGASEDNTRGRRSKAGKQTASMSREEARAILGVSKTASRQEIVSAYRKLMQKNHPDKGGSAYLSQQIHQAKETLLKDMPHDEP